MMNNQLKINYKKNDAKKIVMIILSALIYAINFQVFVENGDLYPGGFTGISRIVASITSTYTSFPVPFYVTYLLLNVLATLLVFKYIGKKFTIYSVLQFTLSAFFITILPPIPLTNDILLIAIFGGICNGFAISIALANNGSSGGFDFIAIYTSNKFNVSTWNYIMYVNGVILIIAGLLFGWNVALYSIIFQYCSTEVIKSLHKRYKLNALIIITSKEKEVCQAIFKTCRHGITKMNGVGEYSNTENAVLYMTCNNYQLNSILSTIKNVDQRVFITISTVDKLIGNFYQVPLE